MIHCFSLPGAGFTGVYQKSWICGILLKLPLWGHNEPWLISCSQAIALSSLTDLVLPNCNWLFDEPVHTKFCVLSQNKNRVPICESVNNDKSQPSSNQTAENPVNHSLWKTSILLDPLFNLFPGPINIWPDSSPSWNPGFLDHSQGGQQTSRKRLGENVYTYNFSKGFIPYEEPLY